MSRPRSIDALVAEIGSTTTLVSAFDGLFDLTSEPRLLGQAMARTSVADGDVTIGLDDARRELEQRIGRVEPRLILATSSAAGGLRMTVHGLTQKMTAAAAREAALGAGGVVRYVSAGRIGDADLECIEAADPGLVLLAGGVEGGDVEVVTHNAHALTRLSMRPIVVYAGNSAAAREVTRTLESAGFRVVVTRNVYPAVDELDIVPARRAIHDAFEEHIVRAPGIGRVREFARDGVLPTPGAVLLAAEALAAVEGDLVVVDVGGATTDVHSVTDGSSEYAALAIEPEPRAKRTVEGDLGTFVSAPHTAALMPKHDRPSVMPPAIPRSPDEVAAVRALAGFAAAAAIERHAGRIERIYTPTGQRTIVRGRDLTACRLVIGTGGALVRLPGGEELLRDAIDVGRRSGRLVPPPDARVALDRDYILACCGALSRHVEPDAVVALMRSSLGLA